MVTRRTLLKAGGVISIPVAVGVGVDRFPFRPNLYDVRMDNRRDESVNVNIRLDADGSTVYQSKVDVPPDEILHHPCEWPRAAWSYEMAVRPSDQENWNTITWNSAERLCKKIVINEVQNDFGPISFYDAGRCPTTLGEHSCE